MHVIDNYCALHLLNMGVKLFSIKIYLKYCIFLLHKVDDVYLMTSSDKLWHQEKIFMYFESIFDSA